jgi:hypothetical protein
MAEFIAEMIKPTSEVNKVSKALLLAETQEREIKESINHIREKIEQADFEFLTHKSDGRVQILYDREKIKQASDLL